MNTTEADDVAAKRETERLRLLSELAREFAMTADDYDALLSVVARRVSELVGDLCILRLLSADGQHLETGDALHHPDPELRAAAREAIASQRQRVGEGITGRVAQTGESVLVPVVDPARLLTSAAPEHRAFVERQRITSLVVVPLLSRGKTIGAMSLSRSDPSRPFTEDDLRFLQDVAAHAALALANARANKARHESEEAHRLLFEASPMPLFVFDVETLRPLAANAEALRLYGYTFDEFKALQVSEVAVAGRETARARLAAWGDAEAAGTSRYRRKDGSEFVAEYTTRTLTFAGRRARITVIKDVTARYEAEQTRALLAAIVESSNDAIVSKRLDGTITSWNSAAERLFGYSAAEMLGAPIVTIIPPDRLDEERSLIDRVAKGERIAHYETARRRKDGGDIAVSVSLAPVRDAAGAVIGVSKTARDLTAQRAAEDALRRTEEQLRQSQKMDAVGRLAGGIAHDFNNVLSVIMSYAELLLDGRPPGDPIHGDLDAIRTAAGHAADLTRQLLAFGRQQIVEPKVLDLNEILAVMDKMVRRIVGEDVELTSVAGPRLGPIRADRSNVEQVILNLVVNARDAMPSGGKLTIETRNVVLDEGYARAHVGSGAGPHVMIAVSDTGVGMDEATQARVFEPFFTTKGPGKGTGLGLATVFGIARQSGGSVWVYSELGKGTTFKVYFPRVEARVDLPDESVAPVTLRGSETILLVEDQEQVRAVAQDILARNGYEVLVAASAREALALCDGHAGSMHLMITDVVMPRMSGRELAERVAVKRPETKVLYMSGYTDDSIVRHGVLAAGLAFIQKPFTPESLTRKVRQVINAPRRRSEPP